MLYLLDRRGGLHVLPHEAGDSVSKVLLTHGIPPTSVLVYRDTDESIISDNAPLDTDALYTARLIEGYDLPGILNLYQPELAGDAGLASDATLLLKRRLSIAPDGSLTMERHSLDPAAAAAHVEETVFSTIDTFSLLEDTPDLVIGISGGVDSGSLLMLLSAYRDRFPDHRLTIRAATFQDFDSRCSEAFGFAARIAERFDVEHHLVEADAAERVFHLTRPIAQILMLMMEGEDAHQAMYVDHHSTRRVLEDFATAQGSSTLALGLHTTDLLAGLVNSWSSGHAMGPIPVRPVGDYRYVLPLAFVPKRELHLYYTEQMGHLPKQTTPNQWEFNPGDRNFLYFLADQLQWQWPGIQHWMFASHTRRTDAHPVFRICENCGGATREIIGAPVWTGLCDVCIVLDKHGWVRKS
ncbi:MAG: Asparagine synthetase protein [Actinomycetota bacterium]|nr:Asparagine synthetase protein [Actinomycetota bacterium]